MKAILIARVSTEEQREAGNSLPAQLARLERYCETKKFTIVQVCSFDESAYTNDRTEFDRIIDLILAQKEKIVVCCDKVDRLSRNVFDKRICVLYEKALSDELELHFVSDGQIINSRISAVEKFQFSISLGLAKYYSDAISDNVRRALEQKLRKGEWPSMAPYGYINIKKGEDSNDIVVDEFEAQVIKKAFELYGTSAYSLDLLRTKIKTEHGVSWSKGQMGKILQNPFYHGIMIVKGKEYPHRYPPIISKELFDRVQAIKTKVLKHPVKLVGLPYIYRGLITCADCGCAITPERQKGYAYYHCTQYKGKHGARWLREEEITRQLLPVFKSMVMPQEVVGQILETLNRVHQDKMVFHNQELSKINREQTILTKMMDNLYMDKLKGSITENDYSKFFEKFKDEQTDLNFRLTQLQEAENNYYITAKCVLDLTTKVFDVFKSSEVDEKRQLIKLLLSNLQLKDEKIVYDVQKPFDDIARMFGKTSWRG